MNAGRRRPASREDARAAKAEAAKLVGKHPAVNGIGITRRDGGYGIKVNLVGDADDVRDLLDRIQTAPVRVEVVGRVSKRAAASSRIQ
jgi:hypothetical protein